MFANLFLSSRISAGGRLWRRGVISYRTCRKGAVTRASWRAPAAVFLSCGTFPSVQKACPSMMSSRSCRRKWPSACDLVGVCWLFPGKPKTRAAELVPQTSPSCVCSFRRPDVVRAAGAAGGGLPGGSLLPDGPLPLYEEWSGHHPQPGQQVGPWDGQAHQQLQTGLRHLCGQEHVPFLLHCGKTSGESVSWVG